MADVSKITATNGTTYDIRDSNLNGHTVQTDVPADAVFTDTVYTLPEATSSDLGGVKVGSNLNIDANGVLTANYNYATCASDADTVDKVATLAGFTLTTGALVNVMFTNTNTATNPTLNVNGTGAYPMHKYGTYTIGTQVQENWHSGAVISFVFDGSHWMMCDYGYRDLATSTKNGLMTSTDKAFLDNLDVATTTADGLMSSSDKVKLNALGNVSNLTYTVVSTW